MLKNQGRRYNLEQARILVENRINYLVGRFPQPVARNAAALDRTVPETVATGLPSSCSTTGPT
ncbi:MAG: hypothetical protein U0168_09110 [Nannocystaceae bacterium]